MPSSGASLARRSPQALERRLRPTQRRWRLRNGGHERLGSSLFGFPELEASGHPRTPRVQWKVAEDIVFSGFASGRAVLPACASQPGLYRAGIDLPAQPASQLLGGRCSLAKIWAGER